MNKLSIKQQSGAETLEFMVVFGLFMMLIITVFDFGRALFVWNALTEATRRGARMAIVCPNNAASQAIVRNVAVFDTFNGALGSSPVVKDLTPAAITINYFDDTGAVDNNPNTIAFAQVSISNAYQFQFIIPYLNSLPFTAPPFSTTLYSESKGTIPTLPGILAPNPRCNF